MAPFDKKDDMGSYLQHFEQYAELQGWKKVEGWLGTVFVSTSEGKSLDVYARLPADQAKDYNVLNRALLKRYALTKEGYKQKFYDRKQ